MTSEIKFTACKNLNYDQAKYAEKLALVTSGGSTGDYEDFEHTINKEGVVL
jgi:hypothetical protein